MSHFRAKKYIVHQNYITGFFKKKSHSRQLDHVEAKNEAPS